MKPDLKIFPHHIQLKQKLTAKNEQPWTETSIWSNCKTVEDNDWTGKAVVRSIMEHTSILSAMIFKRTAFFREGFLEKYFAITFVDP